MSEQYYDTMFNYVGQAAATTLTQMYAGTSSSAGPYLPKANGTLIAMIISATPQAATSLCQLAQFQVTCTLWQPVNQLNFYVPGFGLATAPQVIGGTLAEHVYSCNLPVSTSVGITAFATSFASPVTPNFVIQGFFTA